MLQAKQERCQATTSWQYPSKGNQSW
jgi:hypothetical protein